MIPNPNHQRCGIYCIRNLVNDKVYIGKSKNIYKRIHQHIYDMKNNRKNENPYLQNSWNKYGKDSFEYFVLEFLEEADVLVSERELFWMKIYNSLEKGYNLRSDSDSKMLVHKSTSAKISARLKKEWAEGIRSNHGKKISDSWNKDENRKINQGKLFSFLKTKYMYKIDGNLYSYKELKSIGLSNSIATFHKKRTNKIKFKNVEIERIKIEDIVQS